MRDRIWRTADGQLIPVRQMTDRHLHNCIAKIKRSTTGWRREWLERLEIELVIRSILKESK